MKQPALLLAAMCSLAFTLNSSAAVHYVDANCTNPVSPYTSWATAATNIQDAVVYGGTILVTNGIYQYGSYSASGNNRVYVPNNVTVQSVNGPTVTTIMGYQVPGTMNGSSAVRCVYLNNGSTLSGFTLTDGATQTSGTPFGGGVYCPSTTNCLVTNCVIIGNAAYNVGGGTYYGTFVNCVLSGNTVTPSSSSANGGGAADGVLINCLLTRNVAGYEGGAAEGCKLINCTVVSNISSAYSSVTANRSVTGGPFNNSIIYYNFNTYTNADIGGPNAFSNCCVSFPTSGLTGVNNFTNPPLFANLAGGDFHLNAASPCINAGNNSFIANSTDLDGNPRIVGGTVDLGAYEFQSPVHYVSVSNPAPVPPFTNWFTAATNIQDAIDAANAGDFIVVSNGTYSSGGRVVYGALTNRVVVNKAVTVQGLPSTGMYSPATVIQGNPAMGDNAVRCLYLTNGAAIIGLTLTRGATRFSGDLFSEQSDAGVWCESAGAVVSNCVISGNTAAQYGGGAFQGTLFNCVLTNNSSGYTSYGGGAYSNTLINCTLTRNNSFSGGGAIYCTLSNCLLIANHASTGVSSTPNLGGGGAACSTLTSCVVSSNTAFNGGGVSLSVVNNSLICSNWALAAGGGSYSDALNKSVLSDNAVAANTGNSVGNAASGSTLDYCLITNHNSSILLDACTLNGCVVAGNHNSLMLRNCYALNCTMVTNSGMLSVNSRFQNSIIYYNIFNPATGGGIPSMSNCCADVLAPGGCGNFTNEPLFVNLSGGDFHLQSNSPCINSGNNAYVTTTNDLDGNPRIAGGTVDLGAYEFQSSSSVLSYAWAQQYGLPTDGSADYLDSDGDGMNNWQEWKAGTIPTDPTSVLQLVSPSNSVSGVIVTWQSVSGATYFIQRSTDLGAQPAFSSIQSNIVGQAGTTSYTDANATGPGPFFYRVGVQ